jgi:uncharacterized membrane protein
MKIASTIASQNVTISTGKRAFAIASNRLSYRLCQYWILIFTLVYGAFVGLPFLAPIFMHWGWTLPAKIIYTIYSFLCHQLPERSFFLFGPKAMYSIGEIAQTHWNVGNLGLLRQFIGAPQLGWKVAWSDRMVSMFTSILFFAWAWWPLRKRIRPLPLWALALQLVPMAIDGGTHMLSDILGWGNGFRDTNAWLATLTHNSFPATFYTGDAIGSFNSDMRILTGLLFGMGIVLFAFPYLYSYFRDMGKFLEAKFQKAGREL